MTGRHDFRLSRTNGNFLPGFFEIFYHRLADTSSDMFANVLIVFWGTGLNATLRVVSNGQIKKRGSSR